MVKKRCLKTHLFNAAYTSFLVVASVFNTIVWQCLRCKIYKYFGLLIFKFAVKAP